MLRNNTAVPRAVIAPDAPGINMHRFFYGGRNFEYYSEDALLSARTAAAEVFGARSGGLTVCLKHFVLNDMEQNRARIHTYCKEQALRVNGNTYGITVLNWKPYFSVLCVEFCFLALSCAAAIVIRFRN